LLIEINIFVDCRSLASKFVMGLCEEMEELAEVMGKIVGGANGGGGEGGSDLKLVTLIFVVMNF
jgi:hypothetical protein